jgi:surface polysaccharide O-acyltransferase-like enzyme
LQRNNTLEARTLSLTPGASQPPPSEGRIEWWDRLRIVAFLDIAGFHLHLQHPLWGIGLPIFLLMAIVLASRRSPPQDTAMFVRARTERLLIPWAFWSAVFGMYMVLRAWRHGVDLDRVFDWQMLLGGTMSHMWFLSFIAVAGVGAHLIDRLTQRVPLAPFAMLAIAATLGLLWMGPLSEAGFPFQQWGFSLPAIPLALGVGRIYGRADAPEIARMRLLGYLVVFATLALLLSSQTEIQSGIDASRRYVLALAAIVGCLYLPALAGGMSQRIEKLLLAMYILHVPIQHQIILRLEAVASFQLPPTVGIAMVAALSLVAAWALRLTVLRRFL